MVSFTGGPEPPRDPPSRIWSLGVLLVLWPAPAMSQPATDAELYGAACAVCHGDDGRGRPVEEVPFPTPLPDFTDCAFASREPDPDWYAVIHAGGPVRAFDRMMPAFGSALSDPEIAAILRHVRTFCTDDTWPRGEFNVPRPLFTEKAYPEDEIVVTTTVDARSGNTEGEFLYEKRLGSTGMVELAVPVAYRAADRTSGRRHGQPPARALGVGDLAFGYKRSVHHDLQRGSIFSLGAEAVLASTQDAEGSYRYAPLVEPYAAYAHLLPWDAFVQTQALVEVAVDDQRDHAVELRGALGRTWTEGAFGRSWTPMVEVLVARGLTDRASARVDLVPQVQVSLNTRKHVLLTSACASRRAPQRPAARSSSSISSGTGSTEASGMDGERAQPARAAHPTRFTGVALLALSHAALCIPLSGMPVAAQSGAAGGSPVFSRPRSSASSATAICATSPARTSRSDTTGAGP